MCVCLYSSFSNNASAVTFSKVVNTHRPHNVSVLLHSEILHFPAQYSNRRKRASSLFIKLKKSRSSPLHPWSQPGGGRPSLWLLRHGQTPNSLHNSASGSGTTRTPHSPSHSVCHLVGLSISRVSVTGVCSFMGSARSGLVCVS